MAPATRFGSYRFDPETGQLWDEAREIHRTPKAAAVLGVLLSQAGVPVTKAQLFATVWRDTIVSDHALTTCIQELRRALADDAKRPRFIETRHRRGYRFVAAAVAVASVCGGGAGLRGRHRDQPEPGSRTIPTTTVFGTIHGSSGSWRD